MPFNKKTVRLDDFLTRVREKLHHQDLLVTIFHTLIFFESFIQRTLATDLIRERQADPKLLELDLMAGDFDVIYPFVVLKLHDAASRNFSEVHPDTYREANVISKVFCCELNEFFECSGNELFDFVPIVSFVEMMS